jgi:hypothetical protein
VPRQLHGRGGFGHSHGGVSGWGPEQAVQLGQPCPGASILSFVTRTGVA